MKHSLQHFSKGTIDKFLKFPSWSFERFSERIPPRVTEKIAEEFYEKTLWKKSLKIYLMKSRKSFMDYLRNFSMNFFKNFLPGSSRILSNDWFDYSAWISPEIHQLFLQVFLQKLARSDSFREFKKKFPGMSSMISLNFFSGIHSLILQDNS